MNYFEQFPQCSGCPRLAEYQTHRDTMVRQYEEAEMRERMSRLIADHQLEEQLAAIDVKYLDLLIAIENGDIDASHPKVTEAHMLYAIVSSSINNDERQTAHADESGVSPGTVIETLAGITDREAALVVRYCRGRNAKSLLALGRAGCKSSLSKKLTLRV